jgi:hypothetical protein
MNLPVTINANVNAYREKYRTSKTNSHGHMKLIHKNKEAAVRSFQLSE